MTDHEENPNDHCRCMNEQHGHEAGQCAIVPAYLVRVPSGVELACCTRCMGVRVRDWSPLTGEKSQSGKDPAAVALGRRGGLRGGKARAARLTPQERSEIARDAAMIRWHPEGGE